MSDYYELLNVPRNADEQTIKRAYRSLARQYHPDQNKSAFAVEQMKLINEAYTVLSDAQKRRDYDALLIAKSQATMRAIRRTEQREAINTAARRLFIWTGAVALMILSALTGALLALRERLPAVLAGQLGRATPTAILLVAPSPTALALNATFTASPTATPTPIPSATPAPSATSTHTALPSATATRITLPTATPIPTATFAFNPPVLPVNPNAPRRLVSSEPVQDGSGLNDIFITDVSSGDKQNMTRTGNQAELAPSWAPDGSHVIYSEANSGSLVIINSDGSERIPVATDPRFFDTNPVWSPTAPWVAFRGVPRDGGDSRAIIYMLDVSRQQRRVLSELPGLDLTFSPDGRWIAYKVLQGDGFTLQMVSADGVYKYSFLSRPMQIRRLAWTQDAQRILYESFVRDTNGDGRVDERDQAELYMATLQPLSVLRFSGTAVVVSSRGRFPGPAANGEYYPPFVSTVQQ